MTTVKNTEIQKDCIYHATPKSGKGDHYVFRCGNPGGWKSFVLERGVLGGPGSQNFYWDDYILRFPTTQEADWLIACEQAGKFIPKSQFFSLNTESVINQYEIY